jgi:rhodanese-related sulfurtransferase
MTDALPLQVGVGDLKAALDGGEPVQVLDVREPWEFAIASIPGSVNVPLGMLPERAGDIDPARPVYALCHHGGRSLRATQWLRQNGYRAVNVAGGIDAWAEAIDPGMARY